MKNGSHLPSLLLGRMRPRFRLSSDTRQCFRGHIAIVEERLGSKSAHDLPILVCQCSASTLFQSLWTLTCNVWPLISDIESQLAAERPLLGSLLSTYRKVESTYREVEMSY